MIHQQNKIRLFKYFLLSILAFSCNGIVKDDTHDKFYEVLNKDNKLIGYNYRNYIFDRDTINEKFFSLDKDGKVLSQRVNKFMKINSGIALFSKVDNRVNLNTYFLMKKDSCFFQQEQFKRFNVCFKGFTNFKNYKNVYKINLEEYANDGSIYSIILDKDFTVIAKFEDNNNNLKEILVKKSNVPKLVINECQRLKNP